MQSVIVGHLQAKNLMADLHLPEWHATQGSFLALAQSTHTQWLELLPDFACRYHYSGTNKDIVKLPTPRMSVGHAMKIDQAGPGRQASSVDNWISCAWAPSAKLVFRYLSHGAIPFKDDSYPSLRGNCLPMDRNWPTESNRLEMELSVAPVQLRLFGSLLRHFLTLRVRHVFSCHIL